MAVATRRNMIKRRWKALPFQAEFLADNDTEEILIGGAKGPGKSDGLLIFSIKRRTEFPGSRGLIIRREFADLVKEGSLIPRSEELLSGIAQYNRQEHKWRFPNSSVIEFGHAQHEYDILGYQGAQYDDICVDQLEQFTELQYRILHGAARTTRRDLKPLFRASANPGDVGHAFVKSYFIDVAPPRTVYIDPKTQLRRKFIPATYRDNPYLNPEYVQYLNALPEPWLSAWRDGKWEGFIGQYFSPWRPDPPYVCDPFPLHPNWPRWMAYDWGSASPAWVGWLCRAPWGTIYVYREAYFATQEPQTRRWVGTGLTVDVQIRQAQALMAIGEAASPCYAGPDVFIKGGQTGESHADVTARLGVSMSLATTDRVQGWQRLKRAFQPRRVDRDGQTVEEPEVVIFSTCPHLIRTLPLLVGKENTEDIKDLQEDHPADGLRYGIIEQSGEGASVGEFLLGPQLKTLTERESPWAR